jgi:hypothetical protein
LREVLIEALSLGFGVAELVLVRSVSYDENKQAHNQAKELKASIVELESEII